MPEAHEQVEHAEHAQHAASENKKIALLIAILALFLSFGETLEKSAQTAAIDFNVKSSDLWAFFQAKTIRQTVLRTAAEELALQQAGVTDPTAKAALDKQIQTWKQTVARYESEPETHEGRKELMERARAAEESRDLAMERYHHYELASAAFQIGIVLASAAVITGMVVLAWLGGLLGVAGIVVLALGLFEPHLLAAVL